MPHQTGLLGSGLHEDEAEFGGEFEDEIAARAGGAGRVELDELVGDGASAGGEIGDAGVQGTRGAIAEGRAAGAAEDAVDGFEEAGRVFGDEAESFAIDDDAVFADGGLDEEVLFGRDAGELGELEVGGPEAVEERDEAVGVAAAEGDVAGAEGSPGRGDGAIELLVADAAEDLDVGGGTASTDGGKGTALAEEAAEGH